MESILFEDNPHWVDGAVYDVFAKREALPKALSFLSTKEILAIVGARRVGKSTLVKLIINELLKSVESKNIFFINLEKPMFIPYKNSATYLEKIYDEYLKLANPNLDEKIYFFIDEIQIFENWEVFVKSKYENSNIKFIITGSNSSLLTSNYATLLTGRVLKLRLHSFNFREFLSFKNIDYSSSLKIIQNKIEIQKAQDEYIKWGGYYSVISNSDTNLKKEILKNIAEDVILKDIVPRYKIKNSNEIKDLFYYIVSNTTAIINYTSLAKKLNIDAKSVKEYIAYFEDNFLITLISKHHNKLSESIKSAKKIYMNDNGFLNLGVYSKRNLGAGLENLVFTSLNNKDETICYLRDNREVDFLYKQTLIQVAYTLEDEKTKYRELKAFEEFKTKKVSKCLIVTNDQNSTIDDVEIVSFDRFDLKLF